mmetsp:Transcript_21031/g.29488  ORF Transcript_21031/g.29488 Transcript_21031/m.29488 type:complete len:88 (-) Transcript_21031:345-608(-)
MVQEEADRITIIIGTTMATTMVISVEVIVVITTSGSRRIRLTNMWFSSEKEDPIQNIKPEAQKSKRCASVFDISVIDERNGFINQYI